MFITDKQQHPAAALFMMNITLACWRILRRCALTLPMKQILIDRVVVVHGGGGIVLVGLVERHKEYIEPLVRQPLNALTHGGRCDWSSDVCSSDLLVTGIGSMQIQGTVKTQVHRLVDEINLLKAVPEETD